MLILPLTFGFFFKFRKWITEPGDENQVEVEGRRVDHAVYLNEVLTMYLIVSSLVVVTYDVTVLTL